ncbi:IS3 family transposase [Blautia sp. Sow4_E7]|uniref:IS3 family transposase n=1 Tax=Blautia sp. Sow4_E7 TaxID=3438749 RepID=UPI003F916DB5
MKKSHQHSGERLTEAIYTEVSAKVEASKVTGHRVSTSGMLKFLGVSRSGYRSFLNRTVSATKQRKEAMKKKIQTIYNDSKQNYGAPKITQELRKSGETIAERTVGKYMREMGIKSQWIKPWTTTTRDSDFSNELLNILDEQFNPERPNAVWCTDITYIWTQDGFVYLNCVMDLFARKIIAWTLADTMEVSTVIETINKAKARRNTDLPLIIHSDRGSQYVSNAWREATESMQRSYSHSGYPYDNACIESFHSLIKREWLNRFNIRNYSHAYRLVFEYIETFYNTVRIHSHCDYMSPDEFEKLYERVNVLPAA